MLWKKLKFYKIILILIIIFLPGCAFKGYLRELSSEEYSKHNYEEMISSEYLNQLNIKEELFYKVYWTGIPAGKVSLKIKATESYHDFKVCKISAFAETNKLFSVIYNIKDVFDSYIDSKDFFSRGYFLNRQGRNSKKEKVYYDYQQLKAKIITDSEEKNFDIPNQVQDIISSLYKLRRQSFQIGKVYSVVVNTGEKNLEINYKTEKFATIRVAGMKKTKAFMIKPFIKKGKAYKNKNVEIWLSADKRRIPLLINIDVPLGYMRIVLVQEKGWH